MEFHRVSIGFTFLLADGFALDSRFRGNDGLLWDDGFFVTVGTIIYALGGGFGLLRGRVVGQGQGEGKDGAAAGLTLGLDVTAVGLD